MTFLKSCQFVVFHYSFFNFFPRFSCDERSGHSAIALYLSRKQTERGLGPEETLDLAHHVLKAQLFRPANPGSKYSPRELQALWLAQCSADLSSALACPRNVLQPNMVVSKLLMLAGASPDALADCPGEEAGIPLLSRFVMSGHLGMVSLLVESGADPSKADSRGVAPLMLAAAKNRPGKGNHFICNSLFCPLISLYSS